MLDNSLIMSTILFISSSLGQEHLVVGTGGRVACLPLLSDLLIHVAILGEVHRVLIVLLAHFLGVHKPSRSDVVVLLQRIVESFLLPSNIDCHLLDLLSKRHFHV